MENFKIESRYLKLCYEFRAFIRRMKAAFYRPDYQKFLMCLLIKRLGQEFISKHVAKPLKRSTELLKHSAELLTVYEKTKSSSKSLKISAACLWYNTAHAVPISHDRKLVLITTHVSQYNLRRLCNTPC